MLYLSEVQSNDQSVVNKMGCDLLYHELLTEFKYRPDMCKDISRGMIYYGDAICCNCDEGHDIAVNFISQTIRHDGDLIVHRIHIDKVHSDQTAGECHCLRCLSDNMAGQAVCQSGNICFELVHDSDPQTLGTFRKALHDKVPGDVKCYVMYMSLGVKSLDIITNGESFTYSLGTE